MSLKKIPISKSCRIKIGLTMGDPSGIGPAIALEAARELKGEAEIVLIGDVWVLEKAARHKMANAEIIDLKNISRKTFSFGKVRAEYGKASIDYLDKALELIKESKIDCLVTCPISKQAVNLAGYHYSGHTEYLSEKSHSPNTVMMLLNKELKFSLVTRHIPLKSVSRALSREKLCNTISVTSCALKELFGLKDPSIIVCGVNPHASDNGLIGSEENSILKPAIKKLKSSIRHLDGPLSADVAIHKAKTGQYDCVIAIYHDQALIPLKLSGNQAGVNLTLGLPFIRTSPLHGTAFELASQPQKADPRSLMEAIRIAIRCRLSQLKG